MLVPLPTNHKPLRPTNIPTQTVPLEPLLIVISYLYCSISSHTVGSIDRHDNGCSLTRPCAQSLAARQSPTDSSEPNVSSSPVHTRKKPSDTDRLYVTNLPSSKIQKADLRTALYMLFSTYGPVLDIVALKTMKMRGQAHVVYRDVQTATQAMRSLDGHEFLGRKLVSVCQFIF